MNLQRAVKRVAAMLARIVVLIALLLSLGPLSSELLHAATCVGDTPCKGVQELFILQALREGRRDVWRMPEEVNELHFSGRAFWREFRAA